MVPADPGARLATLADLPVEGEKHAYEIVGGAIVEKAAPSFEHGDAQRAASSFVNSFHREGGDGPSGWWIGVEVDIELEAHELYRPDVSGWRRAKVPLRPRGWPVRIPPDWVCEILSPSTAARDLGPKLRSYHRHRVGHVWIVDPEHEVLTIYRHAAEGYVVALTAGAHEIVAAEPFERLPLRVGAFFGVEGLG